MGEKRSRWDQIVQLRRGIVRRQESHTQNGLRDSQTRDHDPGAHAHQEEPLQILWPLQHGVPEEHQGSIVEVNFQAEQPVENVRRDGIKNLDQGKPKKNHQGNKEGKFGDVHLAAPLGKIKRKINHADKEILGKKNGHAVAEVFAREVFKQEPDNKQKDAAAPVIQDVDSHGGHHQAQPKHD